MRKLTLATSMVAYASSAFAGQVTTNDLSGRWTLTLKCSKAPDGALPYTYIFDVNVKDVCHCDATARMRKFRSFAGVLASGPKPPCGHSG